MFHDQLIQFRIQAKLADLLVELTEENPDLFDSTSHTIRTFILEGLRKHGKLPKQQTMKSFEGKVMKE